MSTSNGIITKPVSIKDVQQTIGNASGDLGTLCKSSTINKWAEFKPFSYPSISPTTGEYHSKTAGGFKVTDSTRGVFSIHTLNYDKPTGGVNSPFRLGDFNGYNHASLAPKLSKGNHSFVGYDNADGFMGASDTAATVYLSITYPDIPITKISEGETIYNNHISIFYYVGNDKYVPYDVDFKELDYSSYKNTKQEISFTQHHNLPTSQSSATDYYLAIGGCEVDKYTGYIFKQWQQNIDDSTQYTDANVTISDYSDYTGYNTFKYITRRLTTDVNVLDFKDLYCKLGGSYTIQIQVLINDSYTNMITLNKASFTSTTMSYTLANGCTLYNNNLYNEDYTVNGSTVKGVCGTIIIPNSLTTSQINTFKIVVNSSDIS